MKTILVPTDFSKNAETALHFALVLAQKLNAKLILLHTYELPSDAIPSSFAHKRLEKNEYRNILENKLKEQSDSFLIPSKLSIETRLEEGPLMDVLNKQIKTSHSDLVVMGTTGAGAFEGALFGSTTANLMATTDCPIMAIPLNVKFPTDFKKMTYATDYKNSDIGAIKKLTEIASLFHAQINVLHISGDEIDAEEEIRLMNDFMKKVNDKVTYNNLSFQILHGNSVEKKLVDYLNEENTDMLVMATHHRDFLDRLLGRSTTKNLALKTTVPLLAFHYSKAPEFRLY